MNAREVHTYTILLTIIALGDKAPTRGVLQDHIEQALEEGTDRHAPYHLAMATALDGNQLDTGSQRIERISKLHESLKGEV